MYVFSNGSLACTRPDGAVWGMPRRIELALFAAGYICINMVYHFGKEYHRSYSPQEIAITLNAHSDQRNSTVTSNSANTHHHQSVIVVTPDAAESFAFNFTEDLWDRVGLASNSTVQATKRPNLQHAVHTSSVRDIFTENVTKAIHSLKTRLMRNTPDGNEDRIVFFDMMASLNKSDVARATASTATRKLALGLSSVTADSATGIVVPAMVSNSSKRKSTFGGRGSRAKK